MADKPLKSITFPGLADKYMIPEIDSTLTQQGEAADAKATGDEISGVKNTLNSVVTTVNSFVPSAKITRTSQETGTINCPSASRHFLLITSSFATVYWFGYLIVASNGTPTSVEFIKGGDTTVATSTNIFSITSGRGSTSWVIADIILLGNACS